jgi:hypothetical protein
MDENPANKICVPIIRPIASALKSFLSKKVV